MLMGSSIARARHASRKRNGRDQPAVSKELDKARCRADAEAGGTVVLLSQASTALVGPQQNLPLCLDTRLIVRVCAYQQR